MPAGIKANSDGSAAIQVGGTDVITLTSGGAATFVTSPTTVQAGTAAAPSITFSGDTDTGIFSPGANTLAFSTNGTEDARFDSAGNMGLGTTNLKTWNVHKALRISGIQALWSDSVANGMASNCYYDSEWKYTTTGAAVQYQQRDGSGNAAHIWLRAGSGSADATCALIEDARISSSGNFGIGTNSPSTKLHVVGVVTATQGVTGTPTFGASQNNAQTISRNTFTKLQFNVEDWDTASCYDNVTNYRFTPNVAGYYQVSARTQFNLDVGLRTESFISLYKNGSEHKRMTSAFGTPASTIANPGGTVIVYLNGTTDYIEAFVYYGDGSATSAINNVVSLNFFQAVLVRAA